MVKIPDFESLGQVAPAQVSTGVATVPNASEPGMQLESTGAAVTKAGDDLQAMLDRTNTMQAMNTFQANAANIGNEFYSKSGAALAQAYPKYMDDLRENANQIASTLTTNQSKYAFQEMTQGHISQEMYKAGVHAGEGLKQYNQQTYQASQDLNLTSFNQAVVTGDGNQAGEVIHGALDHAKKHMTLDLGIPENSPIIQDQLNQLSAAFEKSGVTAINSLPVTDPRRTAVVASLLQGGAVALTTPASAPAAGAPNNNPGNLRDVGATSGFRTFATPEDGMKALQSDITAKINGSPAMKGNSPTLANIISAYAPPAENDTKAYTNFVSQETGIDPNQVLKPADAAKLVPAIAKYEGNSSSASAQAAGAEPSLVTTPTIHGIPIEAADARAMVTAYKTDLSSAMRLQKDQQEAADQKTMQDFEPKLAQNSLTVHEVESSNLSWELKDRLRKEIMEPSKTDPAVFNDFMSRANLPDGTPGKLTDPKEVVSSIGHGLNFEDAQKVQKAIADPDELKDFWKMGHDQLSSSSAMNIDGDGEQRAYKWRIATQKLITDGQAKGLSLHQLIDPASKDYVGGNIENFREDLTAQANNLAKKMRDNTPTAPLPADKTRQSGETPEAYVKRMGL